MPRRGGIATYRFIHARARHEATYTIIINKNLEHYCLLQMHELLYERVPGAHRREQGATNAPKRAGRFLCRPCELIVGVASRTILM